jgi:hypothetical protein
MKTKLLAALLLLCTGSLWAQFTQVSGTVVDPNGVPYANGTIAPRLVANGSPTLNGFPYAPPSQPVGLSSAGSFVMQLADNTKISPSGSTWNFTVCSGPGTSTCFSLSSPITISGVSQSISAQLQAAAIALGTSTQLNAVGGSLSGSFSGNPTWTGNHTFSGVSTFNGLTALNGGGSFAGTFTGSPTLSGNPIMTGGAFPADVRMWGAQLNGTGTTGQGADDSAALANCLMLSGWCMIPNVTGNSPTHMRLATPQFLFGKQQKRISCAGGNQNGFTALSGTTVLDVDNGAAKNGVGPALFFGNVADGLSATTAFFNGVIIDRSCQFNDISGSKNSPGAVGLLNISNASLNASMNNFTLQNLQTTTVAPSAVGTCTLTGGSISSSATIYAQYEAIGPGLTPGPPSSEVSATTNSMGCTTGSACSCTPASPQTIDSTAAGVLVFWATSSGGENQVGLPYVCTAGNCPMTTNLGYGANTAATPVKTIPSSGNSPDTFDHTGGYGYYITGTNGWNCGNHGDSCVAGWANQPLLTNPDCRNMWICINLDQAVAETQITDPHVDMGPAGAYGVVGEASYGISLGHFECNNTANANSPIFIEAQGTSVNRVIGTHLECPAPSATGIKCVACVGHFFTDLQFNMTGSSPVMYTDDSNSKYNTFYARSTVTISAGTINCQWSDRCDEVGGRIIGSTPLLWYYSATTPALGASISSTQMGPQTPASLSLYTPFRLDFALTQVAVGSGGACASNTTIAVNAIYVDPTRSSQQTYTIATYTIAGAGAANTPLLPTSGWVSYPFASKQNQLMNFSTTVTAGNCTTQPTYTLYVQLWEG